MQLFPAILALALSAAGPLVRFDHAPDFEHRSGPSLLFNAEVVGPGVALPDYDGDGRADLYFVNGGVVGRDGLVAERPPDRLYRATAAGFEDATAGAGVSGAGLGQGVLAADLDNDGYTDLLLTGYGEGLYWRNNGDGTFSEQAAARGLPRLYFAAGASAGDIDRDGHLDLYIASYIDFDYRSALPSKVVTANGRYIVDTLGPQIYRGRANNYLRARGDGTYEDLTFAAECGNNELGRSRTLGTLIADLDADGSPEIAIANDQAPLSLYRTAKSPFQEVSARSYLSDARGNMGLAAGDYDADGTLDLFVTHFDHEHNALYRGMRGRYRDSGLRAGLAATDWDTVGWGAAWVDLDADGWLDLVCANGHLFPPVLDPKIPLPARLAPVPQRMHVYRNRGGKDFVQDNADLPAVQGRGLAIGDLDGDLAPDVAVAVNNGRPLLLRSAGKGAVLDLVGTRSNRSATGARIEATLPGTPPRTTRLLTAGNGYLSSDAAPVCLGLGAAKGPVPVTITWPSGARQTLTLAPGERRRVVEPY